MGNIFCRMGPQKGIHFSKAASLGNECERKSQGWTVYW
ncbi:MAG: hypothetical protein DRN37_00285 [Thermoplasmata archaeon]|nr:MAG: hypothetical protein DRN37_00285 [Thermoplasmata archaeon]